MSRADKKLAYAEKKRTVMAEIAEMASQLVKGGKSTREALLDVDRWLSARIKEKPQEGQLYRDVAADYSKRLAEMTNRREMNAVGKLTAEQIMNWRKVLADTVGPDVAAAMSDEEIQDLRNRMQSDVSPDAVAVAAAVSGVV